MDSDIIILILFIVFSLSSSITGIVLYMNSKKADVKEEANKTNADKAKAETLEKETPETTKATDKVKTDKEKCKDERDFDQKTAPITTPKIRPRRSERTISSP